MNRTKADWKSMREMTGISTSQLALHLGKNIATLQYWENPSRSAERYHPSVEAWKELEELRNRQVAALRKDMEGHGLSVPSDGDPELVSIEDVLGPLDSDDPNAVPLTFYHTSRARRSLEAMTHNRRMIALAMELAARGRHVRFEYDQD